MGQHLNRNQRVDATTAASLGRRLEAYAATLTELERAILGAMMNAALPPLDRMRARAPSELLDEAEQGALNALLPGGDKEV